MGFASRIVRKSVRKATPRPVRRVMHPVGTMKSAMTPRPLKQLSRTVYTVTNPLGAAENALIGAALYPGRGGRRTTGAGWSSSSSSEYLSVGGLRAQEAMESEDRLAWLMAVQRERFSPSQRPVIPTPERAALSTVVGPEWRRRKRGVRFWNRTGRRELRAEVQRWAQQQVQVRHQEECRQAEVKQIEADAWWVALSEGQEAVTTAALQAAFADNTAQVAVMHAEGTEARLVLSVPPISVLPAKKAHITPTGRLSSKAWTKTELNGVYVSLIGAHLLATLREAFAVAPSLQSIRVFGNRFEADETQSVLFAVDCDRAETTSDDDQVGETLLHNSPRSLRTSGRAGEVQPWPL
jgi:hypothetical protein